MTTTIRARRLTVDHHGLRARIAMPDGATLSGTIDDTLIGDEHVELLIGEHAFKVPPDTLVELERAG